MFPSQVLTPKVREFVDKYTRNSTRLNSSALSAKLASWRDMMRKDPISRFCVEVNFLYMFSMLGEFQHSKATIRKDVRNSISNLDDWFQSLRLMASAEWYGFSWSEVATEDTETNRKLLKEIRTLDPSSYDFAGEGGEITKVIYKGTFDQELDYNTGIHIVEGLDFAFDYLHGCGRCEAIQPYWELHQLILGVIAIAGQRQSTPILVKKCDTNSDVILVNPNTGQPYIDESGNEVLVKKGWDAVRQLEELGSAGVTCIDPDDELYAITIECDGEFLLNVLKTGEMYRMLGFLVPATIGSFSLSGLGDSGLAEHHLELFKKLTRTTISGLMDRLVKKLFRPLIIYNHGVQKDYGWFDINADDPNALEVAKIAIDAIKTGTPGLDHIDAVNKVRNNLGLPEYNPELPDNETQEYLKSKVTLEGFLLDIKLTLECRF